MARAEEALDDEVLFREGLWRGLDRSDPVVRARLERDYRFAFPDTGEDSTRALRAARALGLQRSDPVVRRRITDVMRRGLVANDRDAPPSDAAIARYYAAHVEQFRDPPRFRISQVFLGAAPGPEHGAADRPGDRPAPGAAAKALPLASATGLATQRELARALGSELAERVATLEPGHWSEPIRSIYGLHRVRVDERRDARQRSLSEVRDSIAAQLREARNRGHRRAALDRLRVAWGAPRAPAAGATP
ncbi:MAG: peptidyl-prolyl cis-trans isomerase [Myxococcota bacterium]